MHKTRHNGERTIVDLSSNITIVPYILGGRAISGCETTVLNKLRPSLQLSHMGNIESIDDYILESSNLIELLPV